MNALIIKLMAVGLTVSQVFTRPPEQVRTQFNPQTDQAVVAQLLKDGCGFMMKQFQAEKLDVEPLLLLMIENARKAKERTAAEPAAPVIREEGDLSADAPPRVASFTEQIARDIDIEMVLTLYKSFCKNEQVDLSKIKFDEVINYYNKEMSNLPDVNQLRGYKLPESTIVLDRNGARFSEIYGQGNRRTHVPLAQIPEVVRRAFVAAEDKDFFKHKGLDPAGVARAMVSSLMGTGRPQGGSTITQQIVKNLLLNDDLTFERKMREMVLAQRLEKVLKKDEILELYLNMIFLGRSSWGVEMAAKSYFGKSIKDVTPTEGALLAGLTKGPNFYNPERNRERAQDRRQYVLFRMKEDGYINDDIFKTATEAPIQLTAFEGPAKRGGYYFLDLINRDAKDTAKIELHKKSYIVRSTIHTELQKLTEKALQDGLADYEAQSGRGKWVGPQGSIAEDLRSEGATWQDTLPKVKAELYDVQWPLAVVLDTRRENPKAGLADGRIVPLRVGPNILRRLKKYDLVFVTVSENRKNTVATLRLPPTVQGAIVVLENKTGRVLSMAGGFSYAASQFNRAYDAARQPGSTLKPFIYLSALNLGFQPNTLIPDTPVNLPPIERGGKYWSPKNYDGGSRGLVTMRRAVEQSLNLPTARIMSELGRTPTEGLDYIRGVTQELGIYRNATRYYPIVLGAQPARLIDMAVAYATVANDGLKPQVHFIDTIEENGRAVYQRPRFNPQPTPSVDRVSYYQLRRILEGTLLRGTATKLKDLAGLVAGKTGTSNDENDAWFVGFTNDIVVAVWVGYDNRNVRANLGDRFTGGRLALPIAEKVLRASFELYRQPEPLGPPPAEIANLIAEYPVDLATGEFGQGNFREVFRRDQGGRNIVNSHRQILRGGETMLGFSHQRGEEDDMRAIPGWGPGEDRLPPGYYRQQPPPGYYQPGVEDQYELWRRRQRQVDPYYRFPNYRPYGGQ